MGKLYNDFNFSVRTRTYEKRVSGMQPLMWEISRDSTPQVISELDYNCSILLHWVAYLRN